MNEKLPSGSKTPSPDPTKQSLLGILRDKRITSDETRADLITDLFKREPVNYRRAYSDEVNHKLGKGPQG